MGPFMRFAAASYPLIFSYFLEKIKGKRHDEITREKYKRKIMGRFSRKRQEKRGFPHHPQMGFPTGVENGKRRSGPFFTETDTVYAAVFTRMSRIYPQFTNIHRRKGK